MKHIENKINAIITVTLLLATACNKTDFIAEGLKDMGFDARVVSTPLSGDEAQTKAQSGNSEAQECFLTDESGSISLPVTCDVMDAADAPITKGTLINNNDDSEHGNMGLSGYLTEFKAYAYDATNGFFTKAAGNCETVTYSSGKWSASHTYRWADETELQIFAYANAPTANIAKITLSKDDSQHMVSRLDYEIPEKASEQNDILAGTYCGKGDRSVTDVATAPIEFHHPLTCVRIKIESAELAKLGAIRKISLIGLIESYSFTMNYSDSFGGASSGCKYEHIVYQDKDGGLDIDEDGYIGVPFIIAPQYINAHPVSLKVETVSGITLYATLSNAGNKLDAGKVNVFNIGYDNNVYVFNLVGDSDVFTYKNTTESEKQTVTLVSYRHSLSNPSDTQPVAFKAEYSTDGGATWMTSNTGLTGFTSNNTGCITATGYNLTASARTTYIPDPDSHFKWENDSYGSMLDLSTVDANGDPTGYINSANCYVIHHPGEYKFPLVYGNFFQYDGECDYAYSTSITGEHILSTFLNCYGEEIKSGYILNDLSLNGHTVNPKACLLWQDAWEGKSGSNPGEGLITEVGIDGNYITFKTATGTNLIESNAMIALYDEKGSNDQYDEGVDQILWSWHIWASEADFSANGCNKSSNGYEFSPVNIGFCKGRKVIYKVTSDSYRQVLIRLTQRQGHAAPIIITVNRPDVVGARRADCTVYQPWRKDPMRAVPYGEPKDWYTINGTSIAKQNAYVLPSGFTQAQAIAAEISHPERVIDDPVWPRARIYYNIWAMGNTTISEEEGAKTIYDPCPVGFKVPHFESFNKFVKDDSKGMGYTDARPDMNVYVYGAFEFFKAPYFFNWSSPSAEGTYMLSSSVSTSNGVNAAILLNLSSGYPTRNLSNNTTSSYPVLPMREIVM